MHPRAACLAPGVCWRDRCPKACVMGCPQTPRDVLPGLVTAASPPGPPAGCHVPTLSCVSLPTPLWGLRSSPWQCRGETEARSSARPPAPPRSSPLPVSPVVLGTRPWGRGGGTSACPAAEEPGAAQPGPGAAIYLPWLARRAGGRAVTRRLLNEGRRMAPRGSRCSGDRAGEGGGVAEPSGSSCLPFPSAASHPPLPHRSPRGAACVRPPARLCPPGSGVLHLRGTPPGRGSCKLHRATWWGGNGVNFIVVTVLGLVTRGLSVCESDPRGLRWAISRFQNEQLPAGGVLRSRRLGRCL